MKTYVISLVRSTDRRERMSKQLDGIGIQYEFFDATDAQEPNFLYSERQTPILSTRRFGYPITINEIACYSSHFRLWQLVTELNEPILVLEDNIDLADNFLDGYKQLKTLSKKYSFFKLSATKRTPYKDIASIEGDLSIVFHAKKTCGIMGYVITPEAAKAFIHNAEKFVEPVDNYMEKPYKHGVKTYNIHPSLVLRAPIKSTIGKKRKLKQNLGFSDKLYIELFRLYEQLRDYIKIKLS